jgi:hypothetical protein
MAAQGEFIELTEMQTAGKVLKNKEKTNFPNFGFSFD